MEGETTVQVGDSKNKMNDIKRQDFKGESRNITDKNVTLKDKKVNKVHTNTTSPIH